MKPLMFTAVLASVAAQFASGQDNGLKARELFYTPPPDVSAQPVKPHATLTTPTAPPVKKVLPMRPPLTTNGNARTTPMQTVANVPLGLRYSVMKRLNSGKFAEVDADSTFRSGDRIRLHVDTNTTGYLYVVMQGSSGNWRLLFPSAEVDGGNNRIVKGTSQQIPAGDTGQFVFDDQSGTEKLFLVLSRKPEEDLDKLIYSINRTIFGSRPDADGPGQRGQRSCEPLARRNKITRPGIREGGRSERAAELRRGEGREGHLRRESEPHR